jgi:hypothetical protein
VEWEGAAGDAAIAQADADVIKARPFLWGLPDAAAIARRGEDTLSAGKQLALDAVDDAERDGFEVGEDYRCTDTRESTTREQLAQRQAQAEAHANFIRHRVGTLVANDQHITAQLKEVTASWGTLAFAESPGVDDAIVGDDKHNGVQPVDHLWKQGPDQPGDPGNPNFPGRDSRGRYTSGNTGSADGAAAAEQRLQDYERQNHTTLIRQQIRAAIIDPKTGQPMLDPKTGKPLYRYYDALEPIPGQPGKYIGIEVKSGSADLTRTQRIFDRAVSPDMPAAGNLNGQPIEITRAIKLDAPQFIPEAPAAGGPAPPNAVGRAPIEAAPPAAPVQPAPVEPVPAPPLRGGLPEVPFGGGLSPYSPVTGPHPVYGPDHHPHHVPLLGEDPEEVP